jgi:hypothetical protein
MLELGSAATTVRPDKWCVRPAKRFMLGETPDRGGYAHQDAN